ncbi:MAG: CdaR family protein [Proteobacteria bacterium]|nr:CdaR family protein [Pseudomonadota bacterium]
MMNFITGYIFKDFKLKALSLVLASMLWLAVSYMGESRMSISVRISADKLSRDLIVSKIGAEEVLVTLNGPVSILKDIRARDVGVSLDLSNVKEGRYVYDLQKNNIRVPKGIQIEEVKPDYVVVEIDGTIEKRLKTIVKLEKKWMGMYSIKSWAPHYANAEGSRGALNNVDVIETVPTDGNFISEEETIDVPLDTKDLIIRKIKPDTIKVILRRN